MKDILVIGGGFFGMYISEYLATKGHRVILAEKDGNFMGRASYNNQARIHNGYHYPRSTLTALRSKVFFPKFVSEFKDCINESFEKYYIISRILNKISAKQFKLFCDRIGLPYNFASQKIKSLINPLYVEDIFGVEEFAFDSNKIKSKMEARILSAGVETHLNLKILSIEKKDNKFVVKAFLMKEKTNSDPIIVDRIFNCTYSSINQVINNSNARFIPLKHELTEIALVKPPDELKNMGITVIDGPFFSFMPFPPRAGLHSFSHVRYTPHFEWFDKNRESYRDAHQLFDKFTRHSAWSSMLKDARRYIPLLSKCQYRDSIWEVKTILPHYEVNDARPILFRPDSEFQGFYSIMGGKIDHIYDIIEMIKKTGI